MRVACWLSKTTRTHAHTHRQICNTRCFSTATMTWTRLNFALYLHCPSCMACACWFKILPWSPLTRVPCVLHTYVSQVLIMKLVYDSFHILTRAFLVLKGLLSVKPVPSRSHDIWTYPQQISSYKQLSLTCFPSVSLPTFTLVGPLSLQTGIPCGAKPSHRHRRSKTGRVGSNKWHC